MHKDNSLTEIPSRRINKQAIGAQAIGAEERDPDSATRAQA